VPTVESRTDHEFVNITEDIGSAHGAVYVDPRQSGDPSRQMVTSFRHLASASELCRWLIDHKFGDDGQ